MITKLRRSGRHVSMAMAAFGTIALGLTLPSGSQDASGDAMPAFAPSGIAWVPSAHAQSPSSDLTRAVSALRGIATMRASFTQTDRAGNRVAGTMTLKRPGKIRFDYGQDADLLVVSNGRSLYLIDYEVNQVERWPISNSPLGALLDPDRDVRQFGTLLSNEGSPIVSVDVRDPNRPEFGRIIMNFARSPNAPDGLQLMNWVAVDAQNYRTTVRLSNHRYGVAVPDSTFRFRDPRRSSRRPR
ncbi:LolA family protein [Erythrobacter sp. Alg231-14]|uniref:LolA family protein n=1 Tax=Erythrobacter sp. Alg231-14 TaxID=1922225 RepID=UPI003FCE86B9